MILQMPNHDHRWLFVASSLDNNIQADQEIAGWASAHGYRLPAPERTYTIYHDKTVTREWKLLERRASYV